MQILSELTLQVVVVGLETRVQSRNIASFLGPQQTYHVPVEVM